MTKNYPPEDEIERLTEHYEKLGDEDVLVEWERGEPVTIDVGEPMVSRWLRFPRQTMDRLREVARVRGIGVTSSSVSGPRNDSRQAATSTIEHSSPTNSNELPDS